MGFFLDLFTPETWNAFQEVGGNITGFRERHRRLAAERVSQGDFFLCYLTRLSRWCGVLQVESEAYEDNNPVFDDPDPFTVRFKVKPIVVLEPELAIPIYEDRIWNRLTITKQYERGHSGWTGFFRGSLNRFEDADAEYLVESMKGQLADPRNYTLSERDLRQLGRKSKVRALNQEVEVEIPDDAVDDGEFDSEIEGNFQATVQMESIRIQSQVAQIGAEMGFHIWVPRNNKVRVLEGIPAGLHEKFLEKLPLNYDEATLRTIEQIDVLWLNRRSMARAFEIEHTTAIYSGLLRMADLLALQPNMDIRLHIVAPDDKRDRVLREIRRPVFSLLDRGPLYDRCSFLSYQSIGALAETAHLSHMSDTIIGEFEESAEV